MELTAEKVRRTVRPEEVKGDYTLDIPVDFVGQERAKRALDMALAPESRAHIAVVADDMSPEMLKRYIQVKVKGRKAKGEKFSLKDLCQVYNFSRPENPSLLTFEPGKGEIFQLTIKRIKERLLKEIPNALEDEAFKETEQDIIRKYREQGKAEYYKYFTETLVKEGLVKKWEEMGWRLFFDEEGGIVNWHPFFSKSLLTDEEWQQISPPFQQQLESIEGKSFDLDKLPPQIAPIIRVSYYKRWEELQKDKAKIVAFTQKVHRKWQEKTDKEIEELENETCDSVLETIFKDSIQRYKNYPRARQFLKDIKEFAKDNRKHFMPPSQQQVMTPFGQATVNTMTAEQARGKNPLIPFEVNLLVNNKDVDPPPIVIAHSPTFSELFGKVERKIVFGDYAADTIIDPTMIKPGLLHRAQGGFLILDLTDIFAFKQPVYVGLMRVLKEKKLRIRDYSDEFGISYGGKTLTPEPMPLELKVIAIVKPELYYLLWRYLLDREIMEAFQVSALFDRDIECKPEHTKAYANWIQAYAGSKKFPVPDAGAIAKIIEHLLREAEDQERFSHNIDRVKTVLKEANVYAQQEKADSIQVKHVNKALEEKIYRSNLLEERLQRAIRKGKILIETDGKRVGQINGLAVYRLDDYEFGIPSRISVATWKGKEGLINIEKESGLDEETHKKGVETFKGYFYNKYGQDKEINFEGRLAFEQNFSGIGGPSASMAELVALLSSIAKKPIRQGIAMTGTVDMHGHLQVIGGVNYKIEGVFKTYKAMGLTGRQGVIIPATNADELMLNEEIVEAMKRGEFHVWSVENVDEACEILMGCQAKEIHEAVNKQLTKWSGKNKKRFHLF